MMQKAEFRFLQPCEQPFKLPVSGVWRSSLAQGGINNDPRNRHAFGIAHGPGFFCGSKLLPVLECDFSVMFLQPVLYIQETNIHAHEQGQDEVFTVHAIAVRDAERAVFIDAEYN